MTQSDESERRFPFHHGRLALSFVGTVRDRGSVGTERLPDARALGAWLHEAGLVRDEIAPSRTVYTRAVALREAIARAAGRVIEGRSPSADDVATINGVARRYAPRPLLDPQTLELVASGRDVAAAALGRIAVDAIECLASADERSRLRACSLDACGSIFLTPAGHRERRWCSMARCGNRAKVAAFRERAATRNAKDTLG